jgi:uncharacterized protein (DUF362 family)/Pyruvate/2-oxoacid:ferredoxin oxidoreductase delta subunit
VEKVIVNKVESYDKVKEFVSSAIDLVEVKEGMSVMVKPNFLLAKDADSPVITNPLVIKAVLEEFIARGAKPFIYEIPSVYKVGVAAKACGVDKICSDLGVEIKEQGEFAFFTNAKNKFYKRLSLPKELNEVDLVVDLAKLKTHSLMGLTLGVKNMFGLVKFDLRGQMHFQTGRDTEKFAHYLVDIYNCINPGLTILDGVVGMEGNGPSNGTPKKFGFMAASKNAYALDNVVVRMMGKSLSDIPIQKVAIDREIYGAKESEVEVVGDDLNFEIKMPDSYISSSKFVTGLMNFAYGKMRRFTDSKPVIVKVECKSCMNCKKICPADAITVKDAKPVIDYEKCIRCFCCHEVCPYDAIDIHKTYLRKLIEKRFNRSLKK